MMLCFLDKDLFLRTVFNATETNIIKYFSITFTSFNSTSTIVLEGPKFPCLLDSKSQIVVEIREIAYVILLRFELYFAVCYIRNNQMEKKRRE